MENLSVGLKKFHQHKLPVKTEYKHSDYHGDYPNELTIKTIEEAERGENMYGPYDTVAEVMEALNAED